jgi:hypothetical protein
MTLIYRVTPSGRARIEPLPGDVPSRCWWAPEFPPMSCNQYPNGDRNCNMLPTMAGGEAWRLGRQRAYRECRRRVLAHWHFVQTHFGEFRNYRISWIAPMPGVREGRRVVAECMLTEHDLAAGVSRQAHPDIVTVADHALDRHGSGGGCSEVDEPYGVPYRCLIPRGFRNLLVACRASGFSSIAASSCRLSRTMMQLGQAAGTAVALARDTGADLPGVPPERLRAALRTRHVQLDWPLPDDLAEHVRAADRDGRSP